MQSKVNLMRCFWFVIPVSLLVIFQARAEHWHYGAGQSCETAGPTCEAPPPPRAPEQPPAYQAPPGMFQQPPATGAVYGAVERRDVEGAALTFPALTLRFPSLRLPTMARSRSNPRMEIDAASAPYMQQAPLAPYAVAAPQLAPPPAAPNSPPSAPNSPNAPNAPNAPQQGPRCDAPRAPACDQSALEQRLRALEVAEERLLARLVELQGALGGAGLDPAAPAPLHAMPVREPMQALPRASIGPPNRSRTAETRPQPAAHYVTQPASYIQEPAAPEPRLLGGRITDIRPVR